MFLDFLLSHNIITDDQYNRALASVDTEFKGSITQALLSVGVVEDEITKAKAAYYKLPYQKITPSQVTPIVLRYVAEETARHYRFIPIGFAEGVLSIGVMEPENIESMNALQFMSAKIGVPFKIFLISNSDFLSILENYKGSTDVVDEAVTELDNEISLASKLSTEKNESTKEEKKEEKIIEDAPIIKIVAVIINHAVEGNASDIHIENTGEVVKVRYRVDGLLHTSLTLPITTFDAVIARIKILARLRLDEKRKPQDSSFASIISGRKIEFRVSTFPAYYGEKVVMRILDSEKGVKSLEGLDLTPSNFELVRNAIKRPYGLILISGPTGSGKSTTLYSMLSEVDKEGSNVVSLEDPVEYQIPGVSQSQVMPEIGYTFAAGLRSILRQDPNVIMVGEIRDKETAQLAIQAALTGHLVLSTIHTNSAIGIVPRLVDMGVDPYLIAPTLIMGMAQRLLRRMHPSARHEVPMDDVTKELVRKQFDDLDPVFRNKITIPDTMFEMRPTSDVPSGTRGRIPVFEMFLVDHDIQEVILKNPVEPELYKQVRSKGMLTLREDALLKAFRGDVPIQEVYTL